MCDYFYNHQLTNQSYFSEVDSRNDKNHPGASSTPSVRNFCTYNPVYRSAYPIISLPTLSSLYVVLMNAMDQTLTDTKQSIQPHVYHNTVCQGL